jgi:hypothetical protein
MIKLLIAAMLFLAFSASAIEKDEPYYVFSYYAYSKHLTSGRYNTDHNFVGLEYRDEDHGIGIATFKNSYYDQSVLVTYSVFWQPTENIETSLSAGYVSGYEFVNKGIIASVAYNKYDKIRPKLSLFGGAIVLSFSFKF